MEINKYTMRLELTELLERVFQLPEVNKVQIRDIDIYCADDNDKIIKSVEQCYHDILSDIDLGIYVTLHPEDVANGHGYHSNPERIGLTRKNYLGLAFSEHASCQMYRVIMKNGIRFDIGFYIKEDSLSPIYQIPLEIKEEIKDEGSYWPRWDLRKADTFWFTQIQALSKLLRGDYLIADHLANTLLNETLVAQMIERDNNYGTNFHRYGYQEELDYRMELESGNAFATHNEVFNMIAWKLYSAAVLYDRLIKRLNPVYEDRSYIFFEIWRQYETDINI